MENADLIALARAARKLRRRDPVRFARLMALAEAYNSLYDAPHEGAVATMRRCTLISPPSLKATA